MWRTKLASIVQQHHQQNFSHERARKSKTEQRRNGPRNRPRLLITENGKFIRAIEARIRPPMRSQILAPPPPPPRVKAKNPTPLRKLTSTTTTSTTTPSLVDLSWSIFECNVTEFLQYPRYISTCLFLLPPSFTMKLSMFLSKRLAVDDDVISILSAAGQGVGELALWGCGFTDHGLRMLKPRIVPHREEGEEGDDDWENEGNSHHLSGFTNLRKLEICDTECVSIREIVSLLSLSSLQTSLVYLSLRNAAGRYHGLDESDSDESNKMLVNSLANLTNLEFLDLRDAWLSSNFESKLRANIPKTTTLLI